VTAACRSVAVETRLHGPTSNQTLPEHPPTHTTQHVGPTTHTVSLNMYADCHLLLRQFRPQLKTVLCHKAVKLLPFLLVYSHHTDSHVSWGHLHQTYCQHSLHQQTLLLVGSHAAPHRLEQSSFICTHC